MKFKVAPAYYPLDEFEDSSQVVEGRTAEHAAEQYVERNLSNLDYPEEIEIRVKEMDSGEVKVFDVIVESVPEARAVEKT